MNDELATPIMVTAVIIMFLIIWGVTTFFTHHKYGKIEAVIEVTYQDGRVENVYWDTYPHAYTKDYSPNLRIELMRRWINNQDTHLRIDAFGETDKIAYGVRSYKIIKNNYIPYTVEEYKSHRKNRNLKMNFLYR